MTDHTERHAPPEDTGWHLDKKVPIGLIIAMIVQVVGVTLYFAEIKKDVELLKADVVTLHTRDNKVEADLRDSIDLIRGQILRMETKLDRLIERSK